MTNGMFSTKNPGACMTTREYIWYILGNLERLMFNDISAQVSADWVYARFLDVLEAMAGDITLEKEFADFDKYKSGYQETD